MRACPAGSVRVYTVEEDFMMTLKGCTKAELLWLIDRLRTRGMYLARILIIDRSP